MPSGAARAVHGTAGRRIWVGSDCALFAAEGDQLREMASGIGLVFTFLEDGPGDLFVGTSAGLLQFHDGSLVKRPSDFAPIRDVLGLG